MEEAIVVQEIAKRFNLELISLLAYSPDFMIVEALWCWLREDLTYHYCYESKDELVRAVDQFCRNINQDPVTVADRLWGASSLDEKVEKLPFPPPTHLTRVSHRARKHSLAMLTWLEGLMGIISRFKPVSRLLKLAQN